MTKMRFPGHAINGAYLPFPKDIEVLIYRRFDTWPGHCSEIAVLFLNNQIVSGEYQYGIYRGPISKNSPRFGSRTLTHHAWILRGHLIIDPTRWCFEMREPAIYAVHKSCIEYDVGGNNFREILMQNPPEVQSPKPTVVQFELPTDLKKLFNVESLIDWDKLMEMANCNPYKIGIQQARKLYQILIKNGHSALIPIDNRRMIIR